MASTSAHHPSLRPRRASSSASWTSPVSVTAAGPVSSTSSVDRRPAYQQPLARANNHHHLHHHPYHHPHPHDMHSLLLHEGGSISRGRSASRAGSAASSTSRSPSSQSSQLSDSPRVRFNGHSHYSDRIGTGVATAATGAGTNANHTSTTPAAGAAATVSGGEEGMMLVSVGGHGIAGSSSGTMSSSITNQRMRRPRRRADEVERLYKCIWNGCEKSYGTLSHLNDHVRLQRHGTKREPHEFKEARRIWRQERKSRRLREHAIQGPNSGSVSSSLLLHRQQHQNQQQQLSSQHHHQPPPRPLSTHHTNSENLLQKGYRPNKYARPDFFGADESSPEAEEAELDGDCFDREEPNSLLLPLTPPGHQHHGPRIAAAATSTSYHTYSRPSSSRNQTLPSYSARSFLNDDLDNHTDSYSHEHSHILSPMQSARAHSPTGSNQEPPKSGFRLPSIAELRLDLTLDEYEAHAALGSLSGAPVARPSSATASGEQHPSRGSRDRRRDSWESPSTSPNANITGPLPSAKFQSRPPYSLAPPPPYHLYANGHDSATNATLSPDFTNNQHRFRITSAASSPSMERPPSRSLNPQAQSQQHQQHQQHSQQSAAGGYSRPRTMSHSRHPSSSRPSTSTTATSTSQSYHLSTPVHPVSNFPFIPAQPPRTTPEASEGEPRRKRRKYEEIERRYHCGWNGCTKAYGTLNHLNDHVSLQGHGNKRRGSEFS